MIFGLEETDTVAQTTCRRGDNGCKENPNNKNRGARHLRTLDSGGRSDWQGKSRVESLLVIAE
jgi:hypothetical protein